MAHELLFGNCLDVMKTMPADSVDAVVTDPPYGLGFMSKEWDHGVPGKIFWDEILRVAKPGAHLLSFGGTRTFHRLACAIEDAGWEIRDTVMWVYGSGFPKSMDVSKSIDKAARGCPQGAPDPLSPKHGMYKSGCSDDNLVGRGFGAGPGQYMKRETQNALGGGELKNRCEKCGKPFFSGNPCLCPKDEPVTEDAKQWNGWGTALKPAWEPIIVARKPLVGTVVKNVLQYGTGAINIDRSRVDPGTPVSGGGNNFDAWRSGENREDRPPIHGNQTDGHTKGRFPANLIHDGSEEVLDIFPNAKGQQGDLKGHNKNRQSPNGCFGKMAPAVDHLKRGDSGSAASFFYCTKASKKERGEGNNHPTVKPLALMKYLCKLVTPPNGLILDPFCGSGSTGIAAIELGYNFSGIELEEASLEIAKSRLERCSQGVK